MAQLPAQEPPSTTPPAEGPYNLSAQAAGSHAEQKLPIQNANTDAKVALGDAASEAGAKNKEQASLSNITAWKDRPRSSRRCFRQTRSAGEWVTGLAKRAVKSSG
jgi:hypothetical protein